MQTVQCITGRLKLDGYCCFTGEHYCRLIVSHAAASKLMFCMDENSSGRQ